MNSALRALEQLAAQVALPLAAGGDLEPVSPIGGRLAQRMAGHVLELEGDLAQRLARARLRAARRLCVIDHLEPPSGAEWMLCAALNDLIQATNPGLGGVVGAERPIRLLEMALQVIDLAGPPHSVGDALSRHASFANAPAITRLDVLVSWWTGSQRFVGRHPPARLVAWPRIRRVRTVTDRVPLHSLIDSSKPWSERWARALECWLAATPLTDLANAHRSQPEFGWTGASLGLVATHHGRILALRALRAVNRLTEAAPALQRATEHLPPDQLEAHKLAADFAQAVDELVTASEA